LEEVEALASRLTGALWDVPQTAWGLTNRGGGVGVLKPNALRKKCRRGHVGKDNGW